MIITPTCVQSQLEGEFHMVKDKDHFHGSDLETIERIYHIKPSEITSFAANVNPLGISSQLKTTLCDRIDAITSYPDRNYSALRTSISNYVHVNPDHIIVGNGSTELISLFVQTTSPKKALLITPTYSEYEREIALHGGTLDTFPLYEEDNFACDVSKLTSVLTNDYDLLIICNPNNPTSTALCTATMRCILDACKAASEQITKRKGSEHTLYVLVDETYVEFASDVTELTAVSLVKEYNHLIVLRGVSKFFASPGLRLGYAMTSNEQLLHEINTHKNPWTINTLAAIAGEIMFADTDYITRTRSLINEERRRVCHCLRQNPHLKIYEPTANFVLVRIVSRAITAAELFEACIQKGLMIRDCITFEGLDAYYFRICFMSKEKNDELLQVIASMLPSNETLLL